MAKYAPKAFNVHGKASEYVPGTLCEVNSGHPTEIAIVTTRGEAVSLLSGEVFPPTTYVAVLAQGKSITLEQE